MPAPSPSDLPTSADTVIIDARPESQERSDDDWTFRTAEGRCATSDQLRLGRLRPVQYR